MPNVERGEMKVGKGGRWEEEQMTAGTDCGDRLMHQMGATGTVDLARCLQTFFSFPDKPSGLCVNMITFSSALDSHLGT